MTLRWEAIGRLCLGGLRDFEFSERKKGYHDECRAIEPVAATGPAQPTTYARRDG